MKLEELQVGQIVDIIYVTEMNNTPKRRNLTNLEVTEVLDKSIKFIQHKEKPRKWWINNDQICAIYKR